MEPYILIPASAEPVPIVISVPHCGTDIPTELVDAFLPAKRKDQDDTDWFLQNLYDYAPGIGISLIFAKYSRWVIDLNRNPDSTPLYSDGRLITGLTTTTDFLGNPIYAAGKEPDQIETERRLANYYWPYYRKLGEILNERKEQFGKVLLWDAHSIRKIVKTIRADPFPDMILGSNDGRSAGEPIIAATLSILRNNYDVRHNDPFKGGHITRYFGKPENGVHALQLERNKMLYMDDLELTYNHTRADDMRKLEQSMFEILIELLRQ